MIKQSFTNISHNIISPNYPSQCYFRQSHMDAMVLQHRQIFHHEEAHQQKQQAMNFRHSVTMATRPIQSNNKRQYQPNGRKSAKTAIQRRPNYKNMIANMNYYKLLPAKDVATDLREVILT